MLFPRGVTQGKTACAFFARCFFWIRGCDNARARKTEVVSGEGKSGNPAGLYAVELLCCEDWTLLLWKWSCLAISSSITTTL